VKPSSLLREPPLWRLLLPGVAAVVLAAALGLYHVYHVRLDHAADVRRVLDQGTSGTTAVRVWGAGMRMSTGFCPCAPVARPERVLYETTDRGEIADLVSRFEPRRYWNLEAPTENCSDLTIDFLRENALLFSVHLKGQDLRSTKGRIPITPDSVARIEQWLAQRQVREQLLGATK